jgi:histone-lysine N-methyltransferase SUV39H
MFFVPMIVFTVLIQMVSQVVQHGRRAAINICKTRDKGWGKRAFVVQDFPDLLSVILGVFAGAKKICNGTFIGIYAGELLTDEVGEARGK